MNNKNSKDKIANFLICILVISLVLTLGLGVAKDRKMVEKNKELKTKYEEEVKLAAEKEKLNTQIIEKANVNDSTATSGTTKSGTTTSGTTTSGTTTSGTTTSGTTTSGTTKSGTTTKSTNSN